MRGKDSGYYVAKRQIGITPAYAGKSLHQVPLRIALGDHPRLCGEKADTQISGKTVEGSPPPMRGKGHLDLNT